MGAAYDEYDYPSYWIGREYEHESEILALNKLLAKISKVGTLLEVGAGYGRIVPTYLHRSKKVILTDPSNKLLRLARQKFNKPKIKFIQSRVENLTKKIKTRSVDTVILVRVLHHIPDYKSCFGEVSRMLRVGGYMVLEFPNCQHFKARISEYLKGNITHSMDIFPKDLGEVNCDKNKRLPFLNYHPETIYQALNDAGLGVVKKLSVSNIRSPFLKKIFPVNLLISLERHLQEALSSIHFGPSIFVLARKK